MGRLKSTRPRIPDPTFFFSVGYWLAKAYGLKDMGTQKNQLAWYANPKLPEQIEVYSDSILIRIENGTTHRLIIDEGEQAWLKRR